MLVSPRWAEPMVRQALGDELMPLALTARPDERGYAAAIEVSLFGAHADALDGWRPAAERTVGPFELRRLENPAPEPPRYDFVASFSPAVEVLQRSRAVPLSEAERERGERVRERRCEWEPHARPRAGGLGGHPTLPRQRFLCHGDSLLDVGVTVIADLDYLPRRCLWAHPPEQGETVLRYRDVPLGTVLYGHTGVHVMAERSRLGAPIELALRVDGVELDRVVHLDGDGWAPFSLPLGSHAGETATVELAVSSPDHRERHFCFEARTR